MGSPSAEAASGDFDARECGRNSPPQAAPAALRRVSAGGRRLDAVQRRDPQRRDAVAGLAQHLEAEAVEGEGLARLGDDARLVDDEAGDGGRLVVGQVPVHGAVEVADRHRAVDIDRAVRLRADALDGDVVLVGDVADDLLEDVLQRHQALHLAVFVDDQGEMHLALEEGVELVGQAGGVGHEPRLGGDGADVDAWSTSPSAAFSARSRSLTWTTPMMFSGSRLP